MSAITVDAEVAVLKGAAKEMIRDLFTVISTWRTVGSFCDHATNGDTIKIIAVTNLNTWLNRNGMAHFPNSQIDKKR
jgi:hypothetical protein